MKAMKKISCSLLLAVALLFSFQINASAASGTIPSNGYEAKITWYDENGRFTVNSGQMIVRYFPGYNEPTQATYGPGESFNYDRIYNFYDTNHKYTHHYASYSVGGVRRYVPYGETRNGVFTRYTSYTVVNW